MDDDGLPLPSLLPLSRPAVQAPIDIPDAPPSSESTGGDADVDMEESDTQKGGQKRGHSALSDRACNMTQYCSTAQFQIEDRAKHSSSSKRAAARTQHSAAKRRAASTFCEY